MKLLIVLALGLSIACLGSAVAAPARDVLKGFNGVDFGTTYDAAKALLGTEARERVTTDQTPYRALIAKVQYFGETLDVEYVFKNEGRFSAAAALVVQPMDDAALSKSRWPTIVTQLKNEYGEPDEEKITLDNLRSVTFNFADGAIVKARLFGSSIIISFKSPSAAKSN